MHGDKCRVWMNIWTLSLLNCCFIVESWSWGHGKYAWMEACGNMQRGAYDYTSRRCMCHNGFGSDADVAIAKDPRCKLRTCPTGRSWNDIATSSITAHRPAECSDRGTCDSSAGLCICFEGFAGPACERTKCPSNDPKADCSGHGKCVDMARYAKFDEAFPLHNTTTSYQYSRNTSQWDSHKIFGCLCDSSWSVGLNSGETQAAEWFGPDCSRKRCPSGDDPLTPLDETDCEGQSYNRELNSSGIAGYYARTTIPYPNLFTMDVDGWYTHAKGYGQSGNKCHTECSNRGKCNHDRGICECFEGFYGSACEKQEEMASGNYRRAIGFVQQPYSSSVGSTGFSITVDPGGNTNVRCAVYQKYALEPTAMEVNQGTGDKGAGVGALNGPVVAVLAAGKYLNGAQYTVTYSGLSPATTYWVYCATASPIASSTTFDDPKAVLSSKLTIVTTGFSTQPVASAITSTSFIITADPATSIDIRCAVYANGAVAPTGAEVVAGTGTGNAAVGVTNGPVVPVVASGKTNNGEPHAITYTGLTLNTQYDIYCATLDTEPVLSNKIDVITTAFTSQPFASMITSTTFNIIVEPSTDINVRCAVYANGASVPTAAEVNAGTGAGGAAVAATNGPVVSVIAAGNTNSGAAHTISYSGLQAGTPYDVYCATAGASPVISNKLDVSTTGFTSHPTSSSITSAGFVVTADPATDIAIRCAVYADGAIAPLGTEVIAGTGTSWSAVGATNGPVVSVVAAGKTNSGDPHAITYAGLSSSTSYDVYCATADAIPVLSNKLDVTTS